MGMFPLGLSETTGLRLRYSSTSGCLQASILNGGAWSSWENLKTSGLDNDNLFVTSELFDDKISEVTGLIPTNFDWEKLTDVPNSITYLSGLSETQYSQLSNALVAQGEDGKILSSHLPNYLTVSGTSAQNLTEFCVDVLSTWFPKLDLENAICEVVSSYDVLEEMRRAGELNNKTIYLTPDTDSTGATFYNEWICYTNEAGTWTLEQVGTTKIDLTDYVTYTALSGTLDSYVTKVALGETLSGYVTNDTFTGTVGSLTDNITEVANSLSGYSTVEFTTQISGNLTKEIENTNKSVSTTSGALSDLIETSYNTLTGLIETTSGKLDSTITAVDNKLSGYATIADVEEVEKTLTGQIKTVEGTLETVSGILDQNISVVSGALDSHLIKYDEILNTVTGHIKDYEDLSNVLTGHIEDYETLNSDLSGHIEDFEELSSELSSHIKDYETLNDNLSSHIKDFETVSGDLDKLTTNFNLVSGALSGTVGDILEDYVTSADIKDFITIDSNISGTAKHALNADIADKFSSAKSISLSGTIHGSVVTDFENDTIVINTSLASGLQIDASMVSGLTISWDKINNIPSSVFVFDDELKTVSSTLTGLIDAAENKLSGYTTVNTTEAVSSTLTGLIDNVDAKLSGYTTVNTTEAVSAVLTGIVDTTAKNLVSSLTDVSGLLEQKIDTVTDTLTGHIETIGTITGNLNADIGIVSTAVSAVNTYVSGGAGLTLSGFAPSDETLSGIAKVYTLIAADGTELGTINIPKDQFLQDVKFVSGSAEEAPKLQFTFNLGDFTEKTVDVDVSTLVDTYKGSNAINVEDYGISLTLNSDYLYQDADGLAISGVASQEELKTVSGVLTGLIDEVDTKLSGYTTVDTTKAVSGVLTGLIEAAENKLSGYTTVDTTKAVSSVLTGLVNEVDTKLSGYTTVDTTKTVSGYLDDNFKALSGSLSGYTTLDTTESVSGYLDGTIKALSGNLSGYTTFNDVKSVTSFLDDNIGAVSGSLSGYTTVDAVKSVSSFLDDNIKALSGNLSGYTTLNTTESVSSYLDDNIKALSGKLSGYTTVDDVKSVSSVLTGLIDNIDGSLSGYTTLDTTKIVSSYLDDTIKALSGSLSGYTTLDTTKSVSSVLTGLIDQVGAVSSGYITSSYLSSYVKNDTIIKFSNDVSGEFTFSGPVISCPITLTKEIPTNIISSVLLNDSSLTVTNGSVNIDLTDYALTSSLNVYAKTADLTNVAKSGLYEDLSGKPTIPSSVADFSDANSYENKIEEVKVNGSALTPTNKSVNIDLTDYALTSSLTGYAKTSELSAHINDAELHNGKQEVWYQNAPHGTTNILLINPDSSTVSPAVQYIPASGPAIDLSIGVVDNIVPTGGNTEQTVPTVQAVINYVGTYAPSGGGNTTPSGLDENQLVRYLEDNEYTTASTVSSIVSSIIEDSSTINDIDLLFSVPLISDDLAETMTQVFLEITACNESDISATLSETSEDVVAFGYDNGTPFSELNRGDIIKVNAKHVFGNNAVREYTYQWSALCSDDSETHIAPKRYCSLHGVMMPSIPAAEDILSLNGNSIMTLINSLQAQIDELKSHQAEATNAVVELDNLITGGNVADFKA